MGQIFVDTSFLVAFHHQGDPFHNQARKVLNKLLKDPTRQFVITDYIFDEFSTVLQNEVSKKYASEMGALLLGNIDFLLERIGEQYFDQAWDVFVSYQDKKWSFTDCTSYVWIRENEPDCCLATDSDFNEFGLVPNLMETSNG